MPYACAGCVNNNISDTLDTQQSHTLSFFFLNTCPALCLSYHKNPHSFIWYYNALCGTLSCWERKFHAFRRGASLHANLNHTIAAHQTIDTSKYTVPIYVDLSCNKARKLGPRSICARKYKKIQKEGHFTCQCDATQKLRDISIAFVCIQKNPNMHELGL